jgi:hypothetical protein
MSTAEQSEKSGEVQTFSNPLHYIRYVLVHNGGTVQQAFDAACDVFNIRDLTLRLKLWAQALFQDKLEKLKLRYANWTEGLRKNKKTKRRK